MKKVKKEIKDYEYGDNKEEVLRKLLLKKAKGFIVEEIVEEKVLDEDNSDLKLIKRKVTTKEIPPDMGAIKYLIEMDSLENDKYSDMTDEELQNEKIKLLKLLKEEEEDIES